MDKRENAGFTLIELIVVVTLVAVLTAIILDRVLSYQEQAEKTAVGQVIAAVRSGLQLQFAGLLVRGERRKLVAFARQNPLSVLSELPKDFGGPMPASVQDLEPGLWYYDARNRELVYCPILDSRLSVEGITPPAKKILRFRVELMGDTPGQTVTDGAKATGIRLSSVTPYQWD